MTESPSRSRLVVRAPELVWAGVAVGMSATVGHRTLSVFLRDPAMSCAYATVALLLLALAVWLKRGSATFAFDVVRCVFFFSAVAFVAVAFPNDVARVLIVAYGVYEFLVPTPLAGRRREPVGA